MNNPRTILITGINGFVGHHLARELKARGHRVLGTGTDTAIDESLQSYVDQYIGGCDLTSPEDVEALPIPEIDGVINLAGLAQMAASFTHQELYMRINVAVHTTLAETLHKLGNTSMRIIAVSSGAIYNNTQPMPLDENSKLATNTSPYSQSKIAMEEAMNAYRTKGLDVVIARPFNHIGPGQAGGFLLPDLFAKLQTASKSGGVVTVGDLTTKRDYTDVRDVVRAYADLATATSLQHSTYNVCSGQSVAGETILELLLKSTSQTGKVIVTRDPELLRPNDPKDLFGSNQRLRDDTNWQPTIPLERTIQDFVDSKS